MEETPLIRLDLRSPLVYAKTPGLVPFVYEGAGEQCAAEELLFCFAIDPAQGQSIEPDREHFFGALLFSGCGPEINGQPVVQLPSGLYLFTQKRKVMNREDCLATAIEQQKDGLWEQHKIENHIYIRYLFEDKKPVTQLFRTIK
jgi:hypothetical protein